MQIKNPYQEIHREFVNAGAKVLLSSGQACVVYGIAAFSKNGDWIVEETDSSCNAVLSVLAEKKADYRLGAPLDVNFLSQGWTSHFEYIENDIRVRIDFCSRPPRVSGLELMWKNAVHANGIDIVDVETLILLKQTRRIRDYSVIGALAEVLGYNENIPEIALEYLQDYESLKKAVEKWPEQSKQSTRNAVQMLISGAPRRDVVMVLALEQDEQIQKDENRIQTMSELSKTYQENFVRLKKVWKENRLPLLEQHRQLKETAIEFLAL